MWNLEKWYRWSYLQNRNRDTDAEISVCIAKGKKAREELGDWDWHTCKIDFLLFSHSVVSLLQPPWTIGHQVPLSMARILDWVAISSSKGASRPKDWIHVSCIDWQILYCWATRETKVHLVKAVVFPVVTYGRECWTIKKAEHQRTDAFELWCQRRLLRVP